MDGNSAIRFFVMDVPNRLLPLLDISVVRVWNPMMPRAGRWNCRIVLMRDAGTLNTPRASVEAVRDSVDEAVIAAVEEARGRMSKWLKTS